MVKKLTKREQDMLDKIDELTQDLQRSQADFENYRRRSEEDAANGQTLAASAVIGQLLPVVDNVHRSLTHIPKDLKTHEYIVGIGKVAKQLDKALNDIGVERLEVVGQEFNPETMQAVQMDEGEGEGEKEVVIEELQTGYVMNGQVIRHAMVKVGKK